MGICFRKITNETIFSERGNKEKMMMIIGSLLGFISVAFGAFAEHGLRGDMATEAFRTLETAIRYNQIYSILIVMIGLNQITGKQNYLGKYLKLSGVLFIVGLVFFSFSIYLSIGFGIPILSIVTPIGGVIIMIAWLSIFIGVALEVKASRS